LIKLLRYILFKKYIGISAFEMASPGNPHRASCIRARFRSVLRARQGAFDDARLTNQRHVELFEQRVQSFSDLRRHLRILETTHHRPAPHTPTQLSLQLPTSAGNVALPAFAAATPALQQSIDIP